MRSLKVSASLQGDTAVASKKVMRPLPSTYRRLVAKRVGESFSEVAEVNEMPMEKPGEGEVLVQINYAGINGGCETFRARGEFWFKDNASKPMYSLGAEGGGTVVAVGSGVSGIKEGQAVACNMAAAFTEYAVCKAFACTPLNGISIAQGTAVTLSGLTAIAALEGTAKISAGETVAVTAAAGGTGHFAVQLALMAGCTVVAICGGAHKVSALKAMAERQGFADSLHVVDYKACDLGMELPKLCPNGVDVVYEGVGGSVREVMLKNLSPSGRLLQVGYISEYPHTQGAEDSGSSAPTSSASDLPPTSELFWQGQNVSRGSQQIIGKIWPSDPMEIGACKKRLFQLAEEGKLEAWTDMSHGFQGVEAIPSAIEYMLDGGHIGKVLIPITPEP